MKEKSVLIFSFMISKFKINTIQMQNYNKVQRNKLFILVFILNVQIEPQIEFAKY